MPIFEQYTKDSNVLYMVALLMLAFLFVAAVHYILIFFQKEQESKQHVIELNLLTQDAELRALRAQINPHFLFNSLNSISALTTANPEQARHMTILLADFFRKSLDLGTREVITVADEISLVSDFLTIEQVRFGKRLQYKKKSIPVPSMLAATAYFATVSGKRRAAWHCQYAFRRNGAHPDKTPE